jgi:putative ABC transport system permease protein
MNITDIIRTANTNLLRSKLRTFLTILAVFVGTITLTLTTGLGEGVRDFVNKQVSSVSADGVIVVAATGGFSNSNPLEVKEYGTTKQEQSVATSTFAQEDIDKIKTVQNVGSVYATYTVLPEYITRADQKKYIMPPLDIHIDGFETPLAAGRSPDSTKNNEMVLAYQYLEPLGFSKPEDAVNQKVKIAFKNVKGEMKENEYTITGVLLNSLTGSFSRLNANELRDLSAYQNQRDTGSTNLIVTTDTSLSKDTFNKVKEDIKAKGYSATSLDDQIQSFNQVIDVIQTVLNGFAIIVIAAAGIGIINTLLMAVYERTREIGLMKALGTKSSEVFTIFAIEAILLGFWGGVIGIGTGIALGFGINAIATATVLKDLEGFNLMVFPAIAVLPILLGTMIVGLLAGTLPAIKASRLDPIEALRYE